MCTKQSVGGIPLKELAQIASAVQVSSTMAMDMLAKQMKADGVDVVGFGAGEPLSLIHI